MIHRQSRMAFELRLMAADLLAANAAEHPVQAARAIRQALERAERYEEMRSYGPTAPMVSRYRAQP